MRSNNDARRGKVGPVKERFLNQAEVMFAETGYDGVSVREVTDAADCSSCEVGFLS